MDEFAHGRRKLSRTYRPASSTDDLALGRLLRIIVSFAREACITSAFGSFDLDDRDGVLRMQIGFGGEMRRQLHGINK